MNDRFWGGLNRGFGDNRNLFDDRRRRSDDCRLFSRSLGDRSFIDLDFDRRNIVGGKLLYYRFGCDRSFVFGGSLGGGFHFGANFCQLGLIAGQSLQLGQGRHGLREHAMSEIEANLFDGLVGFGGLGIFTTADGAGDLNFRRFHRRRIGLHGEGIVPLGGEIDFGGRRTWLG